MQSIDVTLRQTPNSFSTAHRDVPIVQLIELNANHLASIKSWLMGTDDSSWLAEAESAVQSELMSWKGNKN